MVRKAFVKLEDMASTSSSSASLSEVSTAFQAHPPRRQNPPALPRRTESRMARSGAPSVDTHRDQPPPPPSSRGGDGPGDDAEEDEPVLMEVRDVKPQPGSDDDVQMGGFPLLQPAFRNRPAPGVQGAAARARAHVAGRGRGFGAAAGAAIGGAEAAGGAAGPGVGGGGSNAPNNVSFVTNSFTAIGDKVKELNDTLGELQSLGIQHVANLPELVLVGDQSAGKSSLMSSFSGIVLPRSEGACTRCPVHIRLSGAASSPAAAAAGWSCRVSLQEDYKHGPPANVTRANPFGPWYAQRTNIKEFATITDPAKIEDTLRWAQIATLNPSKPHALYKPGTGEIWRRHHRAPEAAGAAGAANGGGSEAGIEERDRDPVLENEAPFSPNTVALDVLAPGMPDLSFYDLPGVFTSAKRDEDQYLVNVVRNLTAKYISHEQAIILWAVPMNADPETSSTFSIIREQKAQPRTIGIMTKADLLPPNQGAEAQWLAMLRGEQHRVGHGYFLTARPTATHDLLLPDDALASQHPRDGGANGGGAAAAAHPADELERQGAFEEAFFNQQLPGLASREWRSCFQDFEDRCGVTRLVSFMSQQLGYEFAKCLPSIKEKVSDKLLDVNDELDNFPDLPDNPELEVRRSLAGFANLVASTLKDPQLTPKLFDLPKQFKQAVLDMKPKYNVKIDVVQGAVASHGGAANGHRASRIDLTRDDDTASQASLSFDNAGSAAAAAAAALTPHRRRRHTDFLDGHAESATASPGTPSKRARPADGGGPVRLDTLQPFEYSPAARTFVARAASHAGGGGYASAAASPLHPGSSQPRHPHAAAASSATAALRAPPAPTLAMIRDVIHAKSNPGMPDIVTEGVYHALCTEAVQPWRRPLEELIDRFAAELEATLQALLLQALGGLQARLVFARATAVLKQFLTERVDRLRADLRTLHRLEAHHIHTLDDVGMRHHRESEAKEMQRHRHYYRMQAFLGDRILADDRDSRKALPSWDLMSDEARKQETARMNQEAAKLGPDTYRIELGVCAYVRGYYLTAAMRFVDTCTLHIVSGLVPDVADTLSHLYLDQHLGLIDAHGAAGPDLFRELMAEDPATAARRATLKEDRRRFQRTMESIERLESSSQHAQRSQDLGI